METVERRIKHYSSSHKILLVGEGDFSFSACLARSFGSAANMVATSLDSREEVVRKYSGAATNLKGLEERGCRIVHQVDAHTMSNHPLLTLINYDRIVFNFPHATLIWREHDFAQILKHQNLVKGFLENAAKMVSSNGEIHVTHKAASPFDRWEIEELANQAGLHAHSKHQYYGWEYPGYENKRGQGSRCDQSFPVGECFTFIFKLTP